MDASSIQATTLAAHRRANRPSGPWLPALATASTCAVLLAATIATNHGRTPGVGRTPAAAPAAASLPANPRTETIVAPERNAPASAMTRSGARLRIVAHDMPRDAAVAELAALTRADVHDPGRLLALAPGLTLDWQGTDPVEAWRRVLGSDIRHAIHCIDHRCRVELLSMDIEGGTMLVPDAPVARTAHARAEEPHPGPANRPDPDLDESALQ